MRRSGLVMVLALACNSPSPPPDATSDAPIVDASVVVDANVDANGPFAPDQYCPGGPSCADTGDDVLLVGAAALEITPMVRFCTGTEPDTSTCTETIDVDTNHNGVYEPEMGDTFHDWNHDGMFEGEWMAGFDNARAAQSVHDAQWVRAIALRYNQTTIVLASLDVIGWFGSEMDLVRDEVRMDATGASVDWISFSATHVHEARDTIGLWGVTNLDSGLDPAYMAYVRSQARDAVLQAVHALQPANVEYTRFRLRDTMFGVRPYICDVRDPNVLDDEVRVMRFVVAGDGTGPGTGQTIATLVNMAAHPESLWDDNTALSSDYVFFLRDAIEHGVVGPSGAMEPPIPGPGIAVFFNGPLGGQIGPDRLRCHPTDTERTACAWDSHSIAQSADRFGYASAIGSQIGYFVLRSLRGGAPAMTAPVRDTTAALGFRRRSFYLTVENTQYHIGINAHIFDRPSFFWDMTRPISRTNLPQIASQVAVIDIGRSQIITAPGELDPILWLGGLEMPYDYTPMGTPIIDPSNPNPPNLVMRPHAPFLRDLARSDAEYVYLFGLTEDFLGYFVPEFDYQLAMVGPYINQAPGDHYEETNSVGPNGWPTVRDQMQQLLAWHP
jgi:hypothetical protein